MFVIVLDVGDIEAAVMCCIMCCYRYEYKINSSKNLSL